MQSADKRMKTQVALLIATAVAEARQQIADAAAQRASRSPQRLSKLISIQQPPKVMAGKALMAQILKEPRVAEQSAREHSVALHTQIKEVTRKRMAAPI